MSDTVVVMARLYPAEGQLPAMLDAIARTIGSIHAEDGCELFAAHTAPDGTVVLIERWRSKEALAAHAAGSAVQAMREARAPFEARPGAVEVLAAAPFGDPAKGAL
jgi:quinol monooxygenase YgiN